MSRMEVGQDGNVMSVRHRNLIRITVSSPTHCVQLAKRDYFEASRPFQRTSTKLLSRLRFLT